MNAQHYSSWQVPALKDELRKRGASTRGKKSELVERLELYDKNFNFCTPQLSPNPDPGMTLPPAESYHDINGDSKLPPLEKQTIRYYFERFNKKLYASENLYASRFLLVARSVTLNQNVYIRGLVKKTMKKLQYQVDIKLADNGTIEESHCECPAGSGIEAHCKHVGVLLIAIHHMYKDKILLTAESQTQKLQTFHKPKKEYGGTPIRAEKIQKRNTKRTIFKPYPIEKIDRNSYNNKIRNLIINFKSTMPLKQMCVPANPIAVSHDHFYLSKTQQEMLLDNLKLTHITQEEITEIEIMTHGQVENRFWHKFRTPRITASSFHTICSLQPKTQASYAKQLLNPKSFTSRATTHGLINEKIALKRYSDIFGVCPSDCGLFISKNKPYLAASPDALLGPDTVIEIKCPYTSRNKMISPETVPYLILENEFLSLKKSTPYYYQIQGQLYCCNKKYCNLIIYTYKDMKIIFLERDDRFINDMLMKLDNFYDKFYKGEIINKYLYKGYHDIIKRH